MGFCLQFLYIALRLQFSHVAEIQVNPFRRTIVLTWILLWINIYSQYSTGVPIFNEVWLLTFTNCYQLCAIIFMTYNSLWEFSTILDINILTTPYEKRRAIKEVEQSGFWSKKSK